MGRLDGKVAIVTGAGRIGNIGLAICEAFLREGARAVIGTDFRTEQAEAIRARVAAQAGGDRFRLLQQDVTSEPDWQRVLQSVLDEFGGLDVLVNNAGISVHGGIETTALDELRKAMAVNHDGLFLGMKTCAPALAAALRRFPGGGAIVNNISMASYMPNATNIGYHVSKAAARMLTLCGAIEFGPRKIRVNSVHPGMVLTPMTAPTGISDAEGAFPNNPFQRVGRPEELAGAVLYLLSDDASYTTGAEIAVDGGWTAGPSTEYVMGQ